MKVKLENEKVGWYNRTNIRLVSEVEGMWDMKEPFLWRINMEKLLALQSAKAKTKSAGINHRTSESEECGRNERRRGTTNVLETQSDGCTIRLLKRANC